MDLLPDDVLERILLYDRGNGRDALSLSSTCRRARETVMNLAARTFVQEMNRVRDGRTKRERNERERHNLWLVSLHCLKNKGTWRKRLWNTVKAAFSSRFPWHEDIRSREEFMSKANPWFGTILLWKGESFFLIDDAWVRIANSCVGEYREDYTLFLRYLKENRIPRNNYSSRHAVNYALCLAECLKHLEAKDQRFLLQEAMTNRCGRYSILIWWEFSNRSAKKCKYFPKCDREKARRIIHQLRENFTRAI